ncbi:MAG TPA: hypothetical protein VJG90_04575 [Candidatus Nanoarchaeia archaeon]|nr:hypothetical protein [Candidatus Nanoarchaeia archaeon]
MTKFIVIGGGTATGTGKTFFTASLSYILSTFGLNVTIIKFDGILNLNFSTLISSKLKKKELIWEGEEIFVTNNNELVDSDIGVYERFLDKNFTKNSSITNGECYQELINKQLQGNFVKGEIITVNSHLIPIYIEKIVKASRGCDVCLIEVGGTLGDNDSIFFIKALAILREKYVEKLIFIHYNYLPMKSKSDILVEDEPFLLKIVKQSYEKAVNSPLKPDLLAIRCDEPFLKKHKERILKDVFLMDKQLIIVPTVKDIYELPTKLMEREEYKIIFSRLGLSITNRKEGHLEKYCLLPVDSEANVLIFGQTESSGSFISLKEGVKHALRHLGKDAIITWPKENESVNIDPRRYDYLIITRGIKEVYKKKNALLNGDIPTLIIGDVFEKRLNTSRCFIIQSNLEYKSRPMKPSLLDFFSLKWKKDKSYQGKKA